MDAKNQPLSRDATSPLRGGEAVRRDASAFRFYDNRQKYLTFVNTCNEKHAIARRACRELRKARPRPPALRLFDAGMGDGTVLSRLMRAAHSLYPTIPVLVVAKEISLEDVRLGIEKMPERFCEHPATVFVLTNLFYAEAPRLMPHDVQSAAALNWQEFRLEGDCAQEYSEQIEEIAGSLAYGWETKTSSKTGNPVYVRPSVLVVYREDHKFLLDPVIPRPGCSFESYDFVLASQPWRARMPAKFKAERILAPLARCLTPGGRMLIIQSFGRDPGLEIIQRCWPGEDPFKVDRFQLLAALKGELGRECKEFSFGVARDEKAVFRYEMHMLPGEVGNRVGTSTLYAAWNAATYVSQIEDERLSAVVQTGAYLEATEAVLKEYGELWFNDETFVVSRRST